MLKPLKSKLQLRILMWQVDVTLPYITGCLIWVVTGTAS